MANSTVISQDFIVLILGVDHNNEYNLAVWHHILRVDIFLETNIQISLDSVCLPVLIFDCLSMFVFRFLRKEKDISMTKLEVVQAESGRMKQKVEFLEKQASDLEAALNNERTQQQVS